MKKKNLFLPLLMAIVMMALSPTKMWAQSTFSGSGSGTEGDPYQIATAAQLGEFRDIVNGLNGFTQKADACAKLTANIENLGSWTPIGTESTPYTGTFDGDGKSITGMTITNYTTSYQGLFGNVSSATLKNFTVSGEMTSSTSDIGEIGGVVGKALSSTIENVVSNVKITVTGATQSHIAGIVGNCDYTTVNLCANNGAINAGASTDCIGGVVGYARDGAKLTACLNTGAISTTGSTNAYIAGIIAYCNNGGFQGVSNSLNTGNITAGSDTYVGAVFGNYGSKITAATNGYNYYKAGTASKAVGAGASTEVLNAFGSVTETQLANGNACYRLNGKTSTGTLYWYQNIGTDNIPVFDNTHMVVYNDGGSYNNPYTVTASNVGYSGQEASKAFDRSTDTKWCGQNGSGTSIYVEFNTSNAMKVGSYTFTTGGDTKDYPVRNPKYWVLKGKVNSTDAEWTVIDTQNNSPKMPSTNKTAVTFNLPALTATAYKYFRIEFTHKKSTTFQLSEITLSSTVSCEHAYDAHHHCTKCDIYDPTYVKAYGTDGGCSWAIYNNTDANYSDGEMVIYPSNGTSGTLAKWDSDDQGWCLSRDLIKSVRFGGNIKSSESLSCMFYKCTNLVSVDFTNLNTDDATSASNLFNGCSSLTTINWANVNTAKATLTYYMFKDCSSLTSLDLSSLNTSQVWRMSKMFYGCSGLTTLTIGNFDMQKVTEMDDMFSNTDNLKTLNLKAVPYLKDKTFNSKFTGEGVTVNYQLDDKSVIYTDIYSYKPVATTAPTYTRTIAADSNWGTLVLPFEVKSDENVQLYTLSAVAGDKMTFTEVETVAANTPCVFKKKTADATSVVFTANSIAAPAAATPVTPAAIGGLTLTGTYSATKVAAEAGYVCDGGQFVKTTAETAVSPFQAYLAGSIDAVDALTIQIGVPGDTNGDGVITIADLTRLVEILNGRATDTNGTADVNGQNGVTVDDVNPLINKLFGK